MKLRLSLFVISLLIMASCATDQQPIGPEPDPGESDFTILEQAGEAILKVLDENEGNRQALISAIRAIPEVETLTEVQDDIDGEPIDQLELTLTDGTPYIVNLVVGEVGEEITPAESNGIDLMLDSLQNLFDSKITPIEGGASGGASSVYENGISSRAMSSPASSGLDRTLNKKKAVLISIDPKLRKEDLSYINKLKDKTGTAAGKVDWEIPSIQALTPEYFSTLGNFDIVVWGSHGRPTGEVFFPYDGMSERQKYTYQKLINRDFKKYPIKTFGIDYPNGVYPCTKKYSDGHVSEGVTLTSRFFNKFFPAKEFLYNTIFWLVHCHSAFNEKRASGLSQTCLARNVAELFGSAQICNGKGVYNVFTQWYSFLINGASSDVAWKNAKPEGAFSKTLAGNKKYRCHKGSRAKYLKPEATGVRRTRTRASDKAAPVVVGARFRYSGDRTGKPEYTGNGGILLREVATGYTSAVPITSDMIQSQRPVEVLEGFVVNEIDVRIDGLKPESDYVYATYIDSDGAMTVSDESFAFRTEKASGQVYYISTEDEFIQIMSKPHDGMAFLMNDITIKKWDKNAEGGSNFRGLYTNLDGQGHKLHFVGGDYAPVSFTISKSFGTDGRQCSNVIFQLDDGGYIEASSPWKIVNCTFRDVNHLSLSADMHGCTLINSPVSISNRGILRDCKFSFENYKGFSDYAIKNSGLVERCQFTPGGDVINFVYNDDNGTVRDCHLDTRSPAMFGCNRGLISNCSLTCVVSEPDMGLNKMMGAISYNYGTVEDFVGDLRFSYEFDYERFGNNLKVMCAGAPLCDENTGRLVRCINRSNIINHRAHLWWWCAAVCEDNSGEITDCENYGDISVNLNNLNICHEDNDWLYGAFRCVCVFNSSKSAKVSGLINHGSYGPRPTCPVCGKQCGTYIRQDVVYRGTYNEKNRRMNRKRPSPRSRVR